ncbi:hypothetical protein CMO96_03980 [Candidatus Woesebacteria bacterium]|nr:hypothetical protein [Candidatus Woesebacteria bacterium]|tara:strand:+ start:2549 stop:2758 length:210 start_codon:yes stop_codon:yes gene_type:complete
MERIPDIDRRNDPQPANIKEAPVEKPHIQNEPFSGQMRKLSSKGPIGYFSRHEHRRGPGRYSNRFNQIV